MKKNKKILLFTDNYNIKGGGAEKVFFSQINELKKEKNIKVYSAGFGLKNKEGKDFKIFKESNNLVIRHFWRLFFNPIMYFKLKRYFKKVSPDIIHLHNINKNTFALLLASRRYKTYMTVHDYKLVCPTQTNIHNNLEICKSGFNKKCFWKHKINNNSLIYLTTVYFFYIRNYFLKKYVNLFISPSSLLKSYLKKQGFNNIKHIPNSINYVNNKKPSSNNNILYMGQLEKNKGIHLLVDYFIKYLKNNKTNINLLIAGTGPLEKDLIKKITKNKLKDRIKLLGWVKSSEQYLNSCLLIQPNLYFDNFPTVILEAMNFYLPILASKRGGAVELVKDNYNGFLYDVLSYNDFEKKLNKILDKKNYKKYSNNSKIFFLEKQKTKDIKELIKLYKNE